MAQQQNRNRQNLAIAPGGNTGDLRFWKVWARGLGVHGAGPPAHDDKGHCSLCDRVFTDRNVQHKHVMWCGHFLCVTCFNQMEASLPWLPDAEYLWRHRNTNVHLWNSQFIRCPVCARHCYGSRSIETWDFYCCYDFSPAL